MAFRKEIKGDNSQANEIGSFNHITIFSDGGGKLIICFCLAMILALIIYLWIAYQMLLIMLVLMLVIGAALFALVFGISCTARHLSDTKRQVRVNKAQENWAEVVYVTEHLIAHRDSVTGVITVENARAIQEIRHFNDRPPQLPELVASQQSQEMDDDGFSEVLGRDVNGKRL